MKRHRLMNAAAGMVFAQINALGIENISVSVVATYKMNTERPQLLIIQSNLGEHLVTLPIDDHSSNEQTKD